MDKLLIQPNQLDTTEGSILDARVFDEDTARWADWVAAYQAWIESRRSENTRKNYSLAWRQFFRFSNCRPWDVTSRLAIDWANDLGHRQQLAPATVSLKLAALSSFFNFVKRKYDLWPADKQNPFDAVDRPTANSQGEALTTAEVKRINQQINLNCLTGRRDFALIMAIYSTGCRKSEILNLKWGDLKEKPGGNYQFEFMGKNRKLNKVELKRRTYQIICDYLEAAGRLETIQPDDYVFTPLFPQRARRLNPDCDLEANRPLDPDTPNKILKKYCRRAGIDPAKAHVHALRHARAGQAYEAMKAERGSVDLSEIMAIMRHSSLNVTQKYVKDFLEEAEDPYGDAAIDAVMPSGKRPRRGKQPPAEQLPLDGLETPEQKIARLQAEIERLQAEVGK